MAGVERKFIIEKLKLFLGEAEVGEGLNKIITSCGLAKKDYYPEEEAMKLIEAMIAEKGFFEFTGRNIKIKLLLDK